VTDWPGWRVPTVQSRDCSAPPPNGLSPAAMVGPAAHEPWLVVFEMKVFPSGMVSRTFTPIAGSCPLLSATMVYVTFCPVGTEFADAVLLTSRRLAQLVVTDAAAALLASFCSTTLPL